MLSPEVWAFSPPACNFDFKYGDYKDRGTVCTNLINTHYFNHLVSVVLPNTVIVPSAITDALGEDSDYYRATNVNINELVNKEFIEAFVKQGQLSILSDNTRIDVDDCVCLTPSGHLVLCLQRETYLELGLEGEPSFFCRKKPTKYIVKIDLKANHFAPGKKNYDRVHWCLTEKLSLKFNLLVAWESPEEKICPSSVAAYLQSRGYEVAVCHPRSTQRLDYNVMVPTLGKQGEEKQHCTSMELLEWHGAYSLEIDLKSGSPENFVNTYQPPTESQTWDQVVYLQWTGYFTTRKILKLFDAIRSYAAEKEDFPWFSLYVQGFADSPVSWGLREHNFFTDGDNEYTIFLQNNNFLACSVLSSTKRPK